MRTISTVLFTVLIVGCASTPRVDTTEQPEYWTSMVAVNNVRNFISIQIAGDQARLLTFFPNPDDYPTICRHTGSVARLSPGSIQFSIAAGPCENKRQMGAIQLDCSAVESGEPTCKTPDGHVLKFKKEKLDLYLFPQDRSTVD